MPKKIPLCSKEGFIICYIYFYKYLNQDPEVNGAAFAPVAPVLTDIILSIFVVSPVIPFLVKAVEKVMFALLTFKVPSWN